MNKAKLFFILIASILCLSNIEHEYHASITTIELDTEERLAKISIQLFTDDLYNLFEKRFEVSPDKLNNLSKSENSILKEYLNTKIQLSINRKPIPITYLGLEEGKNNLVYIYLEGQIQRKPKRIDLSNTVLQDIYSDQINTIHVKLNNVTNSVHLTSTKLKGLLFFNSEEE